MKFCKTLLMFGLVMIAFTITACTKKQSVRNIEPREAFGMLRNDFAVLVDVREADEIANGMAEGAQWMPYNSKMLPNSPEFETWLKTLPKDKEIILYCRSGRRSGIAAAEILANKGFKTANMGGFEEWEKAGLPVKKTTEPK